MVHRAQLLLVELKLARHTGAELTRRVEQAVEGVEELGFEQCVRDKLREVTLRAFDQPEGSGGGEGAEGGVNGGGSGGVAYIKTCIHT